MVRISNITAHFIWIDQLTVFYSHRLRQTPLVSSICAYLIRLPPNVIVQQKSATPKGSANKTKWYLAKHVRHCPTTYQSGSMYNILPPSYLALAISCARCWGSRTTEKNLLYLLRCQDLPRKTEFRISLSTAHTTVDIPAVPAAMKYICITQCSLPPVTAAPFVHLEHARCTVCIPPPPQFSVSRLLSITPSATCQNQCPRSCPAMRTKGLCSCLWAGLSCLLLSLPWCYGCMSSWVSKMASDQTIIRC